MSILMRAKKAIIVLGVLVAIASLLFTSLPAFAGDPLLVPGRDQPKDAEVLKVLQMAGINRNYVKLEQDYGKRSEGKSPYARTWRDQKSAISVMEVSQLPMVDADGKKIEVGWKATENYYTEKNNLFRAKVQGTSVELTTKNVQPDGTLANSTLTFSPQLFLNGVEVKPVSDKPIFLLFDPVDSNYLGNNLEWDYGIAKRRLRIIEGSVLGSWVFPSNPNGEVRIKYNQSGSFYLSLSEFASTSDEELVPQETFAQAKYPFQVGDSVTFYPDATETTSMDGSVAEVHALSDGMSWATLRVAAGTSWNIDSPYLSAAKFASDQVEDKWITLYRGIFLFDTSALPDTATISAATLSLKGNAAYTENELSISPSLNIYSSAPASNITLAAGDFDSLGSTAFSTAIPFASFSTAGYNDFILNASGIAAISLTGVSKFGTREAVYDVGGATPTWSSTDSVAFGVNMAESGSSKPKLVVTYTASPTVTTSAATNVMGTTATLNGNVTSTGGENPTVTVYWGDNNGGTTPASWDFNSVPSSPSQPQGVASFYKNVTGLSTGILYYFSAKATNSGGTGWGTTQSFTTDSAPTITANAASSIALTTARLNGTINNDGGDICDVRWGYGTTTQTAGNFDLYDTIITWSGSYTTGQNPYYDASGLIPSTPYFYRFQARNNVGTTTSNEITFDTLDGVANPTNLQAFPQATSVSLTWVKGGGSTNSLVRYGVSAYPTTITDGFLVYLGTSSSTTHSGLTIGTIYYYSVWGESGGTYSSGYATATTTTLAAGVAGEDLPTPSTPARWLAAPDYTNLSNLLVLYPAINDTADSLGMPRETLWMMLALLFAVGFGIAIYIVSGNKMMLGMIALVLALIFGWVIRIVPFWIPLMTLILVIGIKVSHREVEY